MRKKLKSVVIVDRDMNRVVTAIEVLSPSNKEAGDDRSAYLSKRGEYLGSGVNLTVPAGEFVVLFAPSGVSQARVAQLRAAAKAIARDPGFLTSMNAMDTPVQFLEGSDLDRFLEQDQKRLAGVIKAMGKLE